MAYAGERYAVVVGVQSYRAGQPLPRLPYTENDAAKLADVLKTGGYQVTLMTQTAGRVEGSERFTPMCDYIRDQMDAVFTNPNLTADDVVIVALAGHGVQYGNKAGATSAPQFYFCPADADIRRLKFAGEVKATNHLLDLTELYEGLKNCKAGGKLLLVDACRNDPTKPGVTRSLASNTLPPLPPPPGGTAAFFSCSAHQKAYEDADLKHGVFFHHVIQALKGDADSSTVKVAADGQITLAELSQHVSRKTYDFVRTKFRGAKQAPELKGELRLSLPLIELSRPKKTGEPMKSTAGSSTLTTASSYDIQLHKVVVPNLPKGWAAPRSAVTALDANNKPILQNGGDEHVLATLTGIHLPGDMFVEWEIGSSSAFHQTFSLVTRQPQKEILPIILRYSPSFTAGVGDLNFHYTLPGLKDREFTVSRAERLNPFHCRLERKGDAYTFILNSDETRSYVFRTGINPTFDEFAVSLLNNPLYAVRAGKLSENREKLATTEFRYTARSGKLPPDWYFEGKSNNNRGRLVSPPGRLLMGDTFSLSVDAVVTGVGKYSSVPYRIVLVGADGSRTLPLTMCHYDDRLKSTPTFEGNFPGLSAFKTNIPNGAAFSIVISRTEGNMQFKILAAGRTLVDLALRDAEFDDFDQVKLDTAGGVAFTGIKLSASP